MFLKQITMFSVYASKRKETVKCWKFIQNSLTKTCLTIRYTILHYTRNVYTKKHNLYYYQMIQSCLYLIRCFINIHLLLLLLYYIPAIAPDGSLTTPISLSSSLQMLQKRWPAVMSSAPRQAWMWLIVLGFSAKSSRQPSIRLYVFFGEV